MTRAASRPRMSTRQARPTSLVAVRPCSPRVFAKGRGSFIKVDAAVQGLGSAQFGNTSDICTVHGNHPFTFKYGDSKMIHVTNFRSCRPVIDSSQPAAAAYRPFTTSFLHHVSVPTVCSVLWIRWSGFSCMSFAHEPEIPVDHYGPSFW